MESPHRASPPPPPLNLKPFDGKKLNHSPPSKSLSSPSDGHRNHVSQSDMEVVKKDTEYPEDALQSREDAFQTTEDPDEA